jgi:hypothetical protein
MSISHSIPFNGEQIRPDELAEIGAPLLTNKEERPGVIQQLTPKTLLQMAHLSNDMPAELWIKAAAEKVSTAKATPKISELNLLTTTILRSLVNGAMQDDGHFSLNTNNNNLMACFESLMQATGLETVEACWDAATIDSIKTHPTVEQTQQLLEAIARYSFNDEASKEALVTLIFSYANKRFENALYNNKDESDTQWLKVILNQYKPTNEITCPPHLLKEIIDKILFRPRNKTTTFVAMLFDAKVEDFSYYRDNIFNSTTFSKKALISIAEKTTSNSNKASNLEQLVESTSTKPEEVEALISFIEGNTQKTLSNQYSEQTSDKATQKKNINKQIEHTHKALNAYCQATLLDSTVDTYKRACESTFKQFSNLLREKRRMDKQNGNATLHAHASLFSSKHTYSTNKTDKDYSFDDDSDSVNNNSY